MLEPVLVAPIKRPLARKNTSPSQKMIFLQGHHPERDQSLVVACIRVFKIYWCGFLFDLLPGTHRDQGHLRKIKLAVAERRDLFCLGVKQPSFFFTTPGPLSGPQKNIGTLSCPMGYDKIKGSKWANHRGLMTRADHKKGYPPGFSFKGVQRRANQATGF